MGAPRLVDVNYHVFVQNLKMAADAGTRIEPKEKARWNEYIRTHKVLEASAMSYGKSRSETVKAVIIDGGEWDGYYIYSSDDQFCLKFVRDDA